MKNIMKLLVLVLVLMLGLCTGAMAIEQSDIEGVWDVDVVPILVSQGVPEDQVAELMELMGGMTMTITFTPDQQCIMETVAGGEADRQTFTYTLEGEKILMNDGSVSELVREGDTLTIIDPDGFTMVLSWHGPVGEVAVSASAENSDLVGVWEMDVNAIMAMTGMDMESMTEEEKAMVEAVLAETSMTLEFTADGRVIMSMTMMGETQTEEKAYEVQGSQIIMDGFPSDFVIEGNTLTITEGEASMSMTRYEPAEEPAA